MRLLHLLLHSAGLLTAVPRWPGWVLRARCRVQRHLGEMADVSRFGRL